MRPQEFDFLRDFLRQRSGIVLSTDKLYLVESRLTPVARKQGFPGIDELVARLMNSSDEKLRVAVTDAMTTNESFFFRDQSPFDNLLQHVLPRIVQSRRAKGKNVVRIWSAACSSGQEPYTIAMMLRENEAKFDGMRFEIVATDLSTEIIAKAKEGKYSQFEVQRGLPIQLLVKYFAKVGEDWQLDESIRKTVRYEVFNLLDSYGGLGRFDIVFCRNVLIYFDQETKTQILERIADVTHPDGVLFLGGAESVIGISTRFKPQTGLRGVYQLADANAAKAGAARAAAAGGA